MPPRRFFPDKILKYAEETAETGELPGLLDHLDAYTAGVREARETGRVQPGREGDVELLVRDAHEAGRQIQALLRERGWKLLADAKTWLPS